MGFQQNLRKIDTRFSSGGDREIPSPTQRFSAKELWEIQNNHITEATFAEQWFRLGADEQGHEPSKAALALSLSLLGKNEEARSVKRDCSDAASDAVAEFLAEQGAPNLADTLLTGIDSPEDKAAKLQRTQINSAVAVALGLALVIFIVYLVSEILFA